MRIKAFFLGWVGALACATAMAGCGDDSVPSDPSGGTGGSAICSMDQLLVDGACVDPPACAEGFAPMADGVGCTPVLPEGACPAGTMARLGESACVPVGDVACPDGFVSDPSGWGCEETVAASCVGATRERLGSDTCQPVGAGCNDAFPPAGATVFVDDSFTAGQLDSTHFATIAAALAAAPTGAIIAVHSGTYTEALSIDNNVSLIGRCAEEVQLLGPGGSLVGIEVSRATATIANLTVKGHQPGIVGSSGADLQLDGVVVEANREVGVVAVGTGTSVHVTGSVIRDGVLVGGNLGWGAIAQNGAELLIEDSAVSGNTMVGVGALDQTAQFTLRRSVVRGNRALPSNGLGAAVHVQLGSTATVEASAIIDNDGYGLSVYSDPTLPRSTLTVLDSVIARTTSGPSAGSGNGLYLGGHADVTVTGSTFSENGQSSLSAQGPGSLTVTDSTIARTQLDATGFGIGLGVQGGDITVMVAQSAIVDSHYYGIFGADPGSVIAFDRSLIRGVVAHPIDRVGNGVDLRGGVVFSTDGSTIENVEKVGVMIDAMTAQSQADLVATVLRDLGDAGVFHRLGGRSTITRSAVLRATQVGIYQSDSVGADGQRANAAMTDCTVSQTQPHSSGSLGNGIVSGATLELIGCTIDQTYGFGVLVASAGSGARLENTVVRGTTPEPSSGLYGHGVVALDGTRIDVIGGNVFGNSGIGVVYERSSGILDRVAIDQNTVGLQVQAGTTILETGEAPAEIGPLEVAVTGQTTLEGNGARVGNGQVPLPVLPQIE